MVIFLRLGQRTRRETDNTIHTINFLVEDGTQTRIGSVTVNDKWKVVIGKDEKVRTLQIVDHLVDLRLEPLCPNYGLSRRQLFPFLLLHRTVSTFQKIVNRLELLRKIPHVTTIVPKETQQRPQLTNVLRGYPEFLQRYSISWIWTMTILGDKSTQISNFTKEEMTLVRTQLYTLRSKSR